MLPRHLNVPLTIMARRVHRASHSSILQGQREGMEKEESQRKREKEEKKKESKKVKKRKERKKKECERAKLYYQTTPLYTLLSET